MASGFVFLWELLFVCVSVSLELSLWLFKPFVLLYFQFVFTLLFFFWIPVF